MPVSTVIDGGIGSPGFTSVWNVPRHSPPRSFTAPISVMRALLGRDPPVVSTSTTQNVTWCNGVPRSSNERWALWLFPMRTNVRRGCDARPGRRSGAAHLESDR